ncbi:MAG: histidinol dehydrogenase [Smithella sp.]
MKIIKADADEFNTFFNELRMRGGSFTPELMSTVAEIVRDVAERGDAALFDYTARFDKYELTAETVEVTAEEKKAALSSVRKEDLEVISLAARRIENYHKNQITQGRLIDIEDGVTMGQRILPLERIGIYAPGGKAAYPSTILMATIPARIAGVEEIILVTPSRNGQFNPLIAAAAEVSGVNRIFKIGGAQAVAALAYGTETIPRVDKIVGPGNAYVAAAKKLVFGRVAIDMIAGPSEVVVIADKNTNPSFVAADLLAQLEHDEMAAAVLFTPDEDLAREVSREVDRQMTTLSRITIMEKSQSRFGAIIITKNIDQAIAFSNIFAPEHLELMVEDPAAVLEKVRNAGSVFLGSFTPEALGDYMAGTNHILPTEGTARFSSPLGVYDFVKRMSVLRFSEKALAKLGAKTAYFARMEGLDAHAGSVDVRLNDAKKI